MNNLLRQAQLSAIRRHVRVHKFVMASLVHTLALSCLLSSVHCNNYFVVCIQSGYRYEILRISNSSDSVNTCNSFRPMIYQNYKIQPRILMGCA